ncbi:MAG TPA: hypothetical protein VLT36_03015, partial [Candidatus Dormibacteraeota bacterium]|nr:hypothetical protein [Candidatus Dormibacteraeota bacterium]
EQQGILAVGPEINQWIPTGKVVFPRAETIGKLGLTKQDYVPGEQLTPIYLRETTFIKAPPPRFGSASHC